MPGCSSRLLIDDTVVADICHIHARRKNGPRYRADFSIAERNDFPNLLLLCKTCHKLVDANEIKYPPEKLKEIKQRHEQQGFREITPEIRNQIEVLSTFMRPKRRVRAKSVNSGASVAVGGDNHGNITINQNTHEAKKRSKYPPNSIGSDTNLSGYVDYLFGKAVDYWKPAENMGPGRLGSKIKKRFRLGSGRTRHHLAVERFDDLVNFIVEELLAKSPVGKRQISRENRFYSSFEEWRNS